ncbi:Uncharacterised protein [Sebaldella termitidis]|uniref:Phage tail fibre protein N-terminal domain-containing protein n=1 Tax=Sebaldella termitidis (strain ATCC 33386 / NCTC 11300) TaxID=526218 RepID=D1ALL9_SEBTE|nr:phage tail protein [Sebaldella termitidis]ACZ09362.1 hypothetical protein Sterm_2509 [Sebaldella termitidis ATCC 33386]SUI24682.1 Uncharacterised protein [Sebaldella termitidis]
MASFNGFILTNKGRELLAKAVEGEQLTFTKMEVGDGTFTGDIKTLTALVSKKDDFNINQITNQGNGQVVLKAIINNQSTTTGYYIREIGVFAHGANNIEILYAYNKAIEADYFPAFNSSNAVEFEYNNIIIVDQAQNITAVIDPSMTYITKEEAAEKYVGKDQIATESGRGITSGLDIREGKTAYVLGAEYGGKFGSDLTSIEAKKVYYYWDNVKEIYIPYKALNSDIKESGFITPSIANFVDVSNANNSDIVYTDGPYTISLNLKESILCVHIDKQEITYSIQSLLAILSNFCKVFGYGYGPATIISDFKVFQPPDYRVLSCFGLYVNPNWVFWAGEANTPVESTLYHLHSGTVSIKLVKV